MIQALMSEQLYKAILVKLKVMCEFDLGVSWYKCVCVCVVCVANV